MAGVRRRAELTAALSEVSAIWSEVLDTADVDPDTNFFDAGGSSLTMARVQIALRNERGISVSLTDLFASATIRKMADFVVEQGARSDEDYGARDVNLPGTDDRDADA